MKGQDSFLAAEAGPNVPFHILPKGPIISQDLVAILRTLSGHGNEFPLSLAFIHLRLYSMTIDQ